MAPSTDQDSNALARTTIAAEVRAAHQRIEAHARAGLAEALRAGALLLEAKAMLPHGAWLPWLTDECGVPERTAQLYMRLSRRADELKSATVAPLTIRAAALLLAAPRAGEGDDEDLASHEAVIARGLADAGGAEAFVARWREARTLPEDALHAGGLTPDIIECLDAFALTLADDALDRAVQAALEAGERALDRATTVDECLHVAQLALRLQNSLAAFKLKGERAAGELLAAMPR